MHLFDNLLNDFRAAGFDPDLASAAEFAAWAKADWQAHPPVSVRPLPGCIVLARRPPRSDAALPTAMRAGDGPAPPPQAPRPAAMIDAYAGLHGRPVVHPAGPPPGPTPGYPPGYPGSYPPR